MLQHLVVFGPIIAGTFAIAFINVFKRKIMMPTAVRDAASGVITQAPPVLSPVQFLVVSFWGAAVFFGIGYASIWGGSAPEVLPGFYTAVVCGALVNVLIQWLNAKAASYKKGEVSFTAPLQAMTPLLIVLLALLLGEFPGPIGLAGVALLTTGAYILLYEKVDAKGKPLPILWWDYFGLFKRLGTIVHYQSLSAKDKEKVIVTYLSLGSAALGTIGLIFDGLYTRRGINMQGLIFASMLLAAILGAVSMVWYLLRPDAVGNQKQWVRTLRGRFFFHLKTHYLKLLFLGWIAAWILHVILINPGFNETLVAYVGSLKRFSILASVLLGWALFKEGQVAQRVIAALFIISGAVLISMDDLPNRVSAQMEILGL